MLSPQKISVFPLATDQGQINAYRMPHIHGECAAFWILIGGLKWQN